MTAALTNAQGTGTGSPPPKPAAPAPMSEKNQKALDQFLAVWESRMAKVETLETKIILTETDDTGKSVYTGEASIMKPNYAKMLLKDAANPGNTRKWRHFVANGEHLWEYDYTKKIARVEQLPKDGFQKNLAMSFLFGMKADELKKRFELRIDVDDKDMYSEFYLRVGILPKSKEDMQDFKKAELVFWVNRDEKYRELMMLPARIWFQQPNGNTISWEFKNMTTQKKFLKADFKEPGFPDKDWVSQWSKPPVPTVSRTVAPSK
jgi:TIGR03009 family protein